METQLPMDLRVSLGDEKRVCGRTDGTTLYVEVLPGFLFGRFNRQEILSKFAEAARAAAGERYARSAFGAEGNAAAAAQSGRAEEIQGSKIYIKKKKT